jgi:hypothetical protein
MSRISSRRTLAAVVLSSVATGACVFGTNSPGAPDTGPFHFDASTPGMQTDARVPEAAPVDGTTPEAGKPETGADAAVDAPVDAVIDVAVDAPVDAPVDVTVDAPIDVAIEAPVDVTIDVGIDAPVDAPDEVAIEASPPPQLSITDANNTNPYDFGILTQGTTTPVALFTVTNSGGNPSGTPSIGVTGANAADFHVVSNTCTGAVAANGGQCQVGITFMPATASGESATLTASATPGNAPQIGLKGAGTAPVPSITLSPTTWPAPATSETASTPPTQQFTVTNGGTGPTNALAITGFAAGFALAGGPDNCTGKMVPAGGGTCTFFVAFQPNTNQTPGPAADTITVTDSAADFKTASLTGVALSPTYFVVITPNPGNWGMVPAGRNPKTFTMTNYGVMPAPTIMTVSVANAGNYPFNTGSPTCVGMTLAAYGSAADTCSHQEIFTAPAGAVGSLPTNPQPTLQATGGTVAAILLASDPLQASW